MKSHGDIIMQACATVIESTSELQDDTGSKLQSSGPVLRSQVRTFAVQVLHCIACADGAATVCKWFHDNDNLLLRLVEFMTDSHAPVSYLRVFSLMANHA